MLAADQSKQIIMGRNSVRHGRAEEVLVCFVVDAYFRDDLIDIGLRLGISMCPVNNVEIPSIVFH